MMCDVPSMVKRGCTRMDNIRNDEVWYKENYKYIQLKIKWRTADSSDQNMCK
jgi:hypothetical protein